MVTGRSKKTLATLPTWSRFGRAAFRAIRQQTLLQLDHIDEATILKSALLPRLKTRCAQLTSFIL